MLHYRPYLFTDLFDDFDRLTLPAQQQRRSRWDPRFTTRADKDGYHIEVEVPGVEEKDIDIGIKDGILTVKAERRGMTTSVNDKGKEETKEDVIGTFQTGFNIPDDADLDKVEAQYRNGILHVRLPRDEKKTAEKKITIRKAS